MASSRFGSTGAAEVAPQLMARFRRIRDSNRMVFSHDRNGCSARPEYAECANASRMARETGLIKLFFSAPEERSGKGLNIQPAAKAPVLFIGHATHLLAGFQRA